MSRHLHIAGASLNQTVGDWSGNARRVVDALDAARARGVQLLVLPELCLSGYSLGERVLMTGTTQRAWASLRAVQPHTAGMIAVVGLPIRHRGLLYNATAVLADGQLVGLAVKENLASGDVEYENRWYAGWTRGDVHDHTTPDGQTVPLGALVYDLPGGTSFAVEICEDAWKGNRPGSAYALAGAEIVLNASASWFVIGKAVERRRMITQISAEDHCAYVFASNVGCDATRLVFDGALLVAADGELLAEGDRFRFDEGPQIAAATVDLDALARRRAQSGSWRHQAREAARGALGAPPARVTVPLELAPAPATARPAYWSRGTEHEPVPDPSLGWLARDGLIPRAPSWRDVPHLELELALSLGLRDYLRKSHIRGVTVALSGGRDSSMVALIAARSVRYEHPRLSRAGLRAAVARSVTTIWLGTDNSSAQTEGAATALSTELGARHLAVDMQPLLAAQLATAAKLTGTALSWDTPAHDVPLQNVQARLRGVLAWTAANQDGSLLLTTSNKSEVAVGYATMDGDTAGGLAPIADVPKSLVTAWLTWAADFHGLRSLHAVLGTPATAELRPPDRHQTDEDDLMPFAVLDRLMDQVVRRGQDPVDAFDALWPELSERYCGDARAFAAHIRRFFTLLCRAQWKRERFAISFRVTGFDLDPKSGFRFPAVQAPFTEELDELDAHVAQLRAG
jgi:NAD+ synthase (glutamine-hydrolysing)